MDMNHKVLSGSERFEFDGTPIDATVLDFWAWSQSRLLADGPRGDLAEFIVNTALGIDTTDPKHGWGECDILYPAGDRDIRIEIKCSSYLQAWERDTPSSPVFSIRKTLASDIVSENGGYVYKKRENDKKERRSDIYVFCYYATTDRKMAVPWSLEQWEFYIMPTATINAVFGERRSVSLSSLIDAGAVKVDYASIKTAIDAVIHQLSEQ